MMRGGSIFAKNCQKSGSRQYWSSPRKGPVVFVFRYPNIVLYSVETIVCKALLGYIGYKIAVSRADKFAPRIEALREEERLLVEKKQALLNKKRQEIMNKAQKTKQNSNRV